MAESRPRRPAAAAVPRTAGVQAALTTLLLALSLVTGLLLASLTSRAREAF